MLEGPKAGDTLGTCALCGWCVDESGGCVGCLFVSQPEPNEASEAASDAASEAAVEAEDRHASEQVFEPLPEAGPEPAIEENIPHEGPNVFAKCFAHEQDR